MLMFWVCVLAVSMLLSNWDNKDIRDAASRGTNTAIFQKDDQLIFFIDDWGGAMGNWGKFFTRSKWDAQDFMRQSGDFVRARAADRNRQPSYVCGDEQPVPWAEATDRAVQRPAGRGPSPPVSECGLARGRSRSGV